MLTPREEIATIVVCEDDAVTLELLCDHLVADRFGVLPAPSASDALRLCRYNQPDLLLLDLSLPDASGLDVLRELDPVSAPALRRSHHAKAKLPIGHAASMVRGSAGLRPYVVATSSSSAFFGGRRPSGRSAK